MTPVMRDEAKLCWGNPCNMQQLTTKYGRSSLASINHSILSNNNKTKKLLLETCFRSENEVKMYQQCNIYLGQSELSICKSELTSMIID